MIDRSRFDLLVTNTMAVAHLTLAHKCKQFASEAAIKNHTVDATLAEFAEESIDYKQVLDSGLGASEELGEAYDKAYAACDQKKLQTLVAELPPTLAKIDQPISVDQFKSMVELAAILPDQNSFDSLHQYCQSILSIDNESRDTIREAIADDNLHLLTYNKNIDPSVVMFDDVNTALMIESIQVLPWLLDHYNLSEAELNTVIEYVSSDSEYFLRVFPHLGITTDNYDMVRAVLLKLDEPDTLEAFESIVRKNK